jgi:hypothetical protein
MADDEDGLLGPRAAQALEQRDGRWRVRPFGSSSRIRIGACFSKARASA